MAKDKSLSKEERRAEKKKEKKEKLAEDSGVTKSKSDKKEKKEKKAKREALAEKALNEIQQSKPASVSESKDSEDDAEKSEDGGMNVDVEVVKVVKEENAAKGKEKKVTIVTRPIGALVPFANPLVTEEKTVKKVLKSVKKGM